MKKTLVIVVLLVIMAGCAMYTHGPAPQTIERKIADRIVLQVDSFANIINNQLLPAAQNAKTDPEKLRQLFLESRLAYKKFEWAAEYFTAATTRTVNGPPIPESELSGFVRQPAGLQVIENCLYPSYDADKRQQIILQLKSLSLDCAAYKKYYQHNIIVSWQIWDAAKLEVFRILTLGITGFDDPLAKNGLDEAAYSLRSVNQVLGNYSVGNVNSNINSAFNKAIAYLQIGGGFDDFNRAVFITSYGNVLSTNINQVQQQLSLPSALPRRPLRQNAATLFDTDVFDAMAYAAYPEDGPTVERIALGKKLFNDPGLSATGTRSCASCHRPATAFADGQVKNTVLKEKTPLKRNTPTLINSALQPAQFDDLRATTLEDQAHDVIESKLEMSGSVKQLAVKLSQDAVYRQLFADAYPKSTGITRREITGALATYERTLNLLNSRFDSYMQGNPGAMNAGEINGFNLFMGKAKCGTCHYMPLFNGALPPLYTKMDAEVTGAPATAKGNVVDDDEGRNLITHATVDDHAFKTPTVRNAARTAPYMHNGVFATLEDVIDFYDKGGGAGMGIKIVNQTLSPVPLNLSAKEKQDLIAFIKCLDSR